MGKEKRNFLTKHIMWLVDDFDAWNAYPWGEYTWEKFYQRTVNVVSRHIAHHLAELKKNPNFNATYNLYGFAWAFKLENPNVTLISSPEEIRQAWFMASVDFIQGLVDQDGNFLQDDEARGNYIEHHNGLCGDTKDGNLVEGVDETICQKINRVSVEEGDCVLDYEGDGVHLSQTNDVIQQAQPSSSSSHPGNDEDASHLDDFMEIDGENANDENPTIDVVVPPKDDDRILRTIKPNDACDEVEVDNFEDDYMLMLNDEEKPVKSSLNDMEVKVEEKPSLGRGLGPLKVKKKNCQSALRPNYVLRSTQVRNKMLAMALKPPFGQQSATTPAPKKIKSRITKIEVIVPPFVLEDYSGQPRIQSINHIVTHEPFVENLSRPDDCKSDKENVIIALVMKWLDDVDINTLTMEQYLAWVQDDIRPGMVKPKIGNNVKFEINRNFMRELRHKLFKGTDDEDAHDHARRVLEIAYLFYFPGVTHDAIMLRVERINDSSDNVDAIQASFKGAHLTKECYLKKADKEAEQSKYVGSLKETIIKFCDELIKKQAAEDEWIRKFIENTDSNIRELKTTTKNLQEKAYQLSQTVFTNTCEKVKERMTMGKENVKEPVPRNLLVVQTYVPLMKFLGSIYKKVEFEGEYDMWRLRIEQYFQVQDYALWDVIENGNSFKPVPQTTTNADGSSTSLIPGPVTTEEKVQKKNDVKARSMLLMALPNEHLMTFNQYKDAKTLFAAIQTRFGGNEATKKTQKTLLKQMYENFSAPSTESLDSIFNRLQKIVSQLAILGENISQEDLNLKFLRSLPSEWNTHVVVWRNKPDLDTMSFDDLYNNFKIVEQEVKGTASSSSSSQNMAFVSSPSISTASTQISTANLSDDTVYAFLASQPNGSQLVYENLEQIHEDDIEEMDLKWQLALLSMRTRIGPRNQDNKSRNQDSTRRTVNVEETSSKAMVAIDGAGLFSPLKFDLSNSGLEEFQQPEFKGYGPKTSKSVCKNISNEVRESPDTPLLEKLMSDDKLEKKTVSPTIDKIEFANCNYHQRERVVYGNNYTRVNYNYSTKKAHPSAHRNMVSRAVFMKTGLRPLNTARPVNTAYLKTIVYSARPMSHFSKSTQSTVKRPYQIRTTLTNKNFSQKVNTAKGKFYTARPKAVNTARPNSAVVNAVRANQVNVVKASACWVWRPTKLNSASITLKRHNYVDARGRSKVIHKKKIKAMLTVDAQGT
ncbi:hypothetical protein Tco_0127429 [Tanacetum coccineum]